MYSIPDVVRFHTRMLTFDTAVISTSPLRMQHTDRLHDFPFNHARAIIVTTESLSQPIYSILDIIRFHSRMLTCDTFVISTSPLRMQHTDRFHDFPLNHASAIIVTTESLSQPIYAIVDTIRFHSQMLTCDTVVISTSPLRTQPTHRISPLFC
jgi:hypothetical protein